MNNDYELTITRRELRTANKWLSGYRRLALVGWLAFLGALLWHPGAEAEVLPEHSLACVDEAAWDEQVSLMGAGIPELVQGCVFTNRDYPVRIETQTVFSGSSVWIEGKNMLVWVDSGVLQP